MVFDTCDKVQQTLILIIVIISFEAVLKIKYFVNIFMFSNIKNVCVWRTMLLTLFYFLIELIHWNFKRLNLISDSQLEEDYWVKLNLIHSKSKKWWTLRSSHISVEVEEIYRLHSICNWNFYDFYFHFFMLQHKN